MSNIRTQFLHKGIMLGVCLIGVLFSIYFPKNGAESEKEALLVEHQMEYQTTERDAKMDMSTMTSDSVFIVTYTKKVAE